MAHHPLAALKEGLAKLRKQYEERHNILKSKLAKKEKISNEDEQWLDKEGNLVEEEQLINDLENASDYERGLERLDEKKQSPKPREPDPTATVKSQAQVLEKPVFTKKENATVAQRIKIINWYHANGKNQSKTARHFEPIYPNLKLNQPLVLSWVKNEAKWREEYVKSGGVSRGAKRMRQTQHPEVTEMLSLWVLKAMGDGLLLTGEVLRQKWTQFADLVGIPEDERLNLSEGWLSRFKARNGLKEFKQHGEAASADPTVVDAERARLRELLKKYGYPLRDIFNMDETGLFYGLPPDRGLADKQHSGVKGSKVRLTYAFTANADGSEKKPAFIIGKAKKPRAFGNKTGEQLGFRYRNNAKAWMTMELYQDWLLEWDRHVPPEGLQNIAVENFRANLTAHVQPMDSGIIRCFKAHYRQKYIERSIDRYDSGISPMNIYDINQLEAMRLAEAAWREVNTTTIIHCWQKAGILPDSDSLPSSVPTNVSVPISSLITEDSSADDPIACAEKNVEDTLDLLEETGVLQRSNRMTIDSLLNPEREKIMVTADESTDEEICKAVLHARAAEEDTVINGGDDDVDDDGPPTILTLAFLFPPSHRWFRLVSQDRFAGHIYCESSILCTSLHFFSLNYSLILR
ncbi:DDE-domain-containing protein [Lentinula edodes]|uniref:DDE-domain-containing protein n=1 Tax=Lentinula edodes TaxID=5353 RepID=A0A1Q3E549_LENED|nr:DDE-domain-containing protein [Lentinula edodes]